MSFCAVANLIIYSLHNSFWVNKWIMKLQWYIICVGWGCGFVLRLLWDWDYNMCGMGLWFCIEAVVGLGVIYVWDGVVVLYWGCCGTGIIICVGWGCGFVLRPLWDWEWYMCGMGLWFCIEAVVGLGVIYVWDGVVVLYWGCCGTGSDICVGWGCGFVLRLLWDWDYNMCGMGLWFCIEAVVGLGLLCWICFFLTKLPLCLCFVLLDTWTFSCLKIELNSLI